MKVLKYLTEINAPREKVWETLWNSETYKIWTGVFCDSSDVISDWKEGANVQFLSSEGNGMLSKITEMKPPEIMTFKHLKVIKDGEVIPFDKEHKNWEGALESYKLIPEDDCTILKVKMDSAKEYEDYFNEKFPKALKIIKELSEES